MQALQKLIEENEPDREEGKSSEPSAEEKSSSVTLLFGTGAADTDTITSRDREDGRDMKLPTIIELPNRVMVKKIFVGSVSSHSIAVDVEGKAYSWGLNAFGQLGIDSKAGLVYEPTLIESITDPVVSASCGRQHSLIVTEDGNVFSAGRQLEGQLGLGKVSKDNVKSFTQIESMENVKAVACGAYFSLLINDSGDLFSCGHPEHGVLGRGEDHKRIEKAGRFTFDFEGSFSAIEIFVSGMHALLLSATSALSFHLCFTQTRFLPFLQSKTVQEGNVTNVLYLKSLAFAPFLPVENIAWH